jgi:Fe-S-cluster containining protein
VSFTPDEQRLLVLMQALLEHPEQVVLTAEDATAIAADMHAAVDQATEARAEVIARSGATLACGPGCSACCDQLVAIYAAEAERIVDWLRAPERAEIKAAFLAAYPEWRARTGDRAERITQGDAAAQRVVALEQWRAGVTCAFLANNMCSIYEVRPTPCRTCHAVDTNALCRPTGAEDEPKARMLHFVPLEDLVRRTHALQLAMHYSLGGPRKHAEVLCVAVYERLLR